MLCAPSVPSLRMAPTADANPLGLLTEPAFWVPDRLVYSAWTEHAPFAFWIVDAHRPRTLVELGTYYGYSYLAFCQAVDRLGTGTRCHAVDLWIDEGDIWPGGPMPSSVALEQLREYHDPRYSAFSELIRSSFAEAAQHFPDGSVDLLHIDGVHSWDAVKDDYETWLPKMSDRGVILFHDINVHRDDFGVDRFWKTLKPDFPSFEFDHGHGLGVLGYGTRSTETLGPLFGLSEDQAAATELRRAFARLGAAIADREKLVDPAANPLWPQLDAARLRGDQMRAQLAKARSKATALRSQVTRARAQRDRARAAARQAKATVEAMRSSTSWRVTRPLRGLSRAVKKLFGR